MDPVFQRDGLWELDPEISSRQARTDNIQDDTEVSVYRLYDCTCPALRDGLS